MSVVRIERFPEERIAVVTLDRPPLNAIDEALATRGRGPARGRKAAP